MLKCHWCSATFAVSLLFLTMITFRICLLCVSEVVYLSYFEKSNLLWKKSVIVIDERNMFLIFMLFLDEGDTYLHL